MSQNQINEEVESLRDCIVRAERDLHDMKKRLESMLNPPSEMSVRHERELLEVLLRQQNEKTASV